MKTSEQGREFIKSFEKLRLSAYDDGVGVQTLGYGHTAGVKRGDTCTEEQADAWFDEEIAKFEDAVTDMVKVDLSQQQFDGLISFAYNVGSGALRSSTLLKMLTLGGYADAAKRFLDWDKGMVGGRLQPLAGLTKRRAAERKIFEDGIYEMHQ